jgi:hypothetical protein
MSGIKSELENDFRQSLANIDFENYNPLSDEFRNALFIGLMENLLFGKTEIESESDDVADEISDCKKYLQRYYDTKDETFREMAKDELRHAGIMLKKAWNKIPSAEEKPKLKDYESRINELKDLIGT